MAKKRTNSRNATTANTPPTSPDIDLDGDELDVSADTVIDDDASSLGDDFERGHASDKQPAKRNQPSGTTVTNSDDRSTTTDRDDGRPTVIELLDSPKTKTTGGKGTGGRTLVVCETNGAIVVRDPRADDHERPQCPNCSTDAAAVLCGANNTKNDSIGATTYYYCPIDYCSFSTQVLKPMIANNIIKRHRNGGRPANPKPHITRP